MSERIMILGGSLLQLPAILKAKEMGLQVIVVDRDCNAIGFDHADTRVVVSTTDTPAVIDAAKQYEINGVLTLATDLPMRTVASVCTALGLPGIDEETAFRATHKGAMRDCLKENAVPIPRYYRVYTDTEYQSVVKNLPNRFVVKPADGSGSRGVFLADASDPKSVSYALEHSSSHSRCGEVIVEEYMIGSEVSVEALSIAGEIHVVAVTDKLTTGAPRFVEIGHSQPSQLPANEIKQVEQVALAAVKAIGVNDGAAHVELILTDSGPKVVELGARLGGDNITSHLVPLSTGVDMVKCCIQLALGHKPDVTPRHNKGAAIRYIMAGNGIVKNVKGIDQAMSITGVKDVVFLKKLGDKLGEVSCSLDRPGYVIAEASSAQDAITRCEQALQQIDIDIMSSGGVR